MRKFTMEVIDHENDEGLTVRCVNGSKDCGCFHAFELLGILQNKVIDINNQIIGKIVPEIKYDRIVHAEVPK
jgi:hypothetical protein